MNQDDKLSQRLTLSLPTALLEQIDRLAVHDYVGRSDIVRQALLKYIREPQNDLIANPDSVVIAKMYDYVKADHPYLDPSDVELIKFLHDQKIGKEGGEGEV